MKNNAIIPMDLINTMWVWIPRYSYTIGSMDGENYYGKQGEFLTTGPTQTLPGEIDVEFVDKNTKDRGSAKYKVSDGVSGWYTPDTFTFGNEELSGIWIGKFETSNKEGNFTSDSDSLTPIVKPKVTSWRNIKISTLETVSMKMNKENNIYGFAQSEVDTHAAKGSEWALAAYLSQSKYGKLGNKSYSGANKEIYMNAYTGFRTGCSYGGPIFPNSSGEQTCSNDYDEIEDRGEGTGAAGAGASTTGNIYGIYDTSGGSWEYVMANLKKTDKRSGNTKDFNSGYTGKLADDTNFEGRDWEEDRYYDFYATASSNTACTIDGVSNRPCSGHALFETRNWYGGLSHELGASYHPWYIRGGSINDSNFKYSDIFASGIHVGAGHIDDSFRIVLTPNN